MTAKLAIVFCVHHKPWLMMSTLLTLVSQERQNADLFFAYNLGDGASARESYREYREVLQLQPEQPDADRAVARLEGRRRS